MTVSHLSELHFAHGCLSWSVGQMTDSAMLTFTLRRLRASAVLLAPFVKLQRKFLRQVLTIFGGADKAPRLQALLFIRHMAAVLPPPALELALKVRFTQTETELLDTARDP